MELRFNDVDSNIQKLDSSLSTVEEKIDNKKN